MEAEKGSLVTSGFPLSQRNWESNRAIIKQLYLDEDRTLGQVMDIMREQYHFRATAKMYKSRITRWGLDKRSKRADMIIISKIQARREAQGKKTMFHVRGREVRPDDVRRYIKRNKLPSEQETTDSGATTPPHVRYMTPPQEPQPDASATIHTSVSSAHDSGELLNSSHQALSRSIERRFVSPKDSDKEQSEFTFRTSRRFDDQANDLVLSRRSTRASQGTTFLPHVVLPPLDFRTAEQLFKSIRLYCDQSFDNGAWRYDELHNLIHGEDDDPGSGTLIYEFYDCFRTGVQLLDRQSNARGRQAISRGMSFIQNMLQSEHPRLLECLLRTFLMLNRRGYMAILGSLLNLIKGMARTTLPPAHPLLHLCEAVSARTAADENMLLQSWRCISDSFAENLGKLSPATVMCYNNLIRAAYEPKEAVRVEHMIFDLLLEMSGREHDLISCMTRLQLVYNMIVQGKLSEADDMLETILDKINVLKNLEADFRGKVYEAKATIKYLRRQSVPAERYLISSIEHHASLRGANDSIVMNLKVRLENWLRESGQDEEANQLKQEIEDWLGLDDFELEI